MSEIPEEIVVAEGQVVASRLVEWFRERLLTAVAERENADQARVSAEDERRAADSQRESVDQARVSAEDQRRAANEERA